MSNVEQLALARKKLLPIFNHQNSWTIIGSEHRPEPRYIVEAKPRHEGAMASIYKAYDRAMGRYMAVKVPHDFIQDSHRSMIKREAQTMAKISHPGIPRIYDLTITDSPEGKSAPVMIMEYIEEESLEQRLKSHIPLQPKDVVQIINQVASATDYIGQKHRLYHGDMGPGQILLSRPHVKIVDFGISTAVSPTVAEYDPEFSAPERILAKVRNPATEEFSLAATAYNMITGKTVVIDFRDLQNPVVKFDLSRHSLKYDSSEDEIFLLNGIFKKALAAKPEERYQSDIQFAGDFASIMRNAKIKKDFFGSILHGLIS